MYSRYRHILQTAQWSQATAMLPRQQKPWLLEQGSLTQRLQQICTKLTVEVLQQGWQAVTFAQNFAKFNQNVTASEPVWLREVVLAGDEVDWVFAQTSLPQRTIQNVAQAVPNLGDTPIGLWLFPQTPKRQCLEWWQDPQTGLYARRSILTLNHYPIEIKEIFLEDFGFL